MSFRISARVAVLTQPVLGVIIRGTLVIHPSSELLIYWLSDGELSIS